MKHTAPFPTADPEFFLPKFRPVAMLRKRANGWTPQHQRMFIAMLAETGKDCAPSYSLWTSQPVPL